MGLFQLANTNTFGQLVTAIAGLLGISNYLTDGPSLVANTELILTKPGTTLNVSSDAIIGNLSATNISTPKLYTTSLSVTGNVVASNLFAVGNKSVSPKTFTRAELSNTQILSGFLYFGFNQVNAAIHTAQAWGVTNLSVTPNGSLTLSALYANSVNLLSGTMVLDTSTIATGTIQTLQNSGVYNSSFVGSISNSILSNCVFSQTQGLHKANVGLSNVDNTSDATKDAAAANLSNKTLMSPLIITGNVSADPTVSTQIASASYANTTQLIRNPIINGCLDIWQRGNTVVGVTGPIKIYLADRWAYIATTSTATVTLNRSNNVPTFANSGVIFDFSYEVDITTADATIQAGNYVAIEQAIEGYEWKQIAQNPFTLSFWVMSSKTGTHCVAARNSGNDRAYIGLYTINSADTWEYKTITFSASPSTGNWNYTTGSGLQLAFVLAVGSTYQTTENIWQTGNFLGTSAQVNVTDNTANFFRFTGVKIESGSAATPLVKPFFMREMSRCKRYYQKSFDLNTSPSSNVGINTGEHRFTTFKSGVVTMNSPTVLLPVSLRTTSTTRVLYNPANTNNEVRDVTNNVDCSGSGLSVWSVDTLSIATAGHSSTGVGDVLAVHWTVDNEL